MTVMTGAAAGAVQSEREFRKSSDARARHFQNLAKPLFPTDLSLNATPIIPSEPAD
jgi:hypothetical protein